MHPNLKAFLDTIAWSEIGPGILAMPEAEDGYKVLVGSTPKQLLLMPSYITHPRVHNQAMNSDAAGRYQFMGRYWYYYKTLLNLPDFGPESQDKWAIQDIKECHAFDDVLAGNFSAALFKCRSRWASLPGSGYGQHENEFAALQTAYTTAGGILA